jgi:uncharacterized membrane protein
MLFSGLLSFYPHSEWIVFLSMICKYFGKKVVREKRKKDIWEEDLLVSYFWRSVSEADFVAKKNVIFILFIRFVKILILVYICMFLWNLLFLAIQVIPICLFSFHPWIIGLI